mmetsp:Transcript_9349/g.10873  ORF Transcript_9349/g.10873 Transcript_9349/m.10873 type:complete len:587 (-) Transcript_9349:155-1915(-)
MKFILQAVIGALSFVPTQAIHHQSDIYYHEKPILGASMWHFSTEGLTIYSPSGENVLKQHAKNMLCPEYTSYRDDSIVNDCNYYAWASDGHRYVWAGSMAGDHHVQAFDIDTGDYAGYIDTCSTPLDMEYHPARQEMYLRCAQATPENGNDGEIDVFSSATLSADIPMISFNATVRPYGRFAIHSAMGPYGYSLAYDQNFITEMDLSAKTVSNTYEIPNAYGGYDTTYSPINQHLYFRARVCCTCGTNNTNPDIEECGRGPGKPVMVKTGPSKSDVEQPYGACSAGCEGSLADTIGVVEFDTVNKKFVDTHNIKEGSGFGADPISSPDGKWIVLLPNDGGKYVRILQPGPNGESSATFNDVKDVMVDFTGGTPGKIVISDFAFVQDENRDILVLGASTDNNIVLIDLRSDSMTTRKIDLAPGVAESTGGSSRNLEWAVDTDYVWVDGAESEEQYIIKIPSDINSAKVDRTLGGIASGNMMFVNNYERMRAVVHATTAAAATQNTAIVSISSADNDNEMSSSFSPDNNKSDKLGVAGVVLGSIGLVAGLGAMVLVLNKEPTSASSLAVPAPKRDVEEAMSLGSKQVN